MRLRLRIPRPLGIEVWRGPSPYNGQELVAVATGIKEPSKNIKTGAMLQLYIFEAAAAPLSFSTAACGTCNLGPRELCYVVRCQGPNQTWKTWAAGGYPRLSARSHRHLFAGQRIRLGAYGDPAMVPFGVLRQLCGWCVDHTGFTHQWRWRPPYYAQLLHASCETPAAAHQARARGWKTFRVMTPGQNREGDEKTCRNEALGRQCIDCCRCKGGNGDNRVIMRHGSPQLIVRWDKHFGASI